MPLELPSESSDRVFPERERDLPDKAFTPSTRSPILGAIEIVPEKPVLSPRSATVPCATEALPVCCGVAAVAAVAATVVTAFKIVDFKFNAVVASPVIFPAIASVAPGSVVG